MTARLAVSFESRLEHVSLAGAAVRAMCEARGLDSESTAAVELATVEVTTNAVEHAYHGRSDQPVKIEVAFHDDHVEVAVSDRGSPVPPERLATAELPAIEVERAEHLPEGGFGLALLRMLTDEVSATSRDGWNTLRFVRRLGPRASSGEKT
jgi:serine/threonine-protein kinase RsbW